MAAERPHSDQAPDRHKWLKRFGWLVGIWTASVVALALAAYLMRLVMNWMGLSSG